MDDGGIILPSPPIFLVFTHSRATRVTMLVYFKAYLRGKIIAILLPYLCIPQYIAEKLLLKLYKRRGEATEPDVLSWEPVTCKSVLVTTPPRDDSRSSCRTKQLL